MLALSPRVRQVSCFLGHMCLVTNPAHAPLLLAAPTQRLLALPRPSPTTSNDGSPTWHTVARNAQPTHTQSMQRRQHSSGATTPTKSWKRPTVNVVASAGAPLFMRRAKLQRYSSNRRRNEDKVICCKSMRLVGMRWCVGYVCVEVWPCDTSLVHEGGAQLTHNTLGKSWGGG